MVTHASDALIVQYDITPDLAELEAAAAHIRALGARRSAIAREELPACEREMETIEGDLTIAIANMVDDKGKPLYSNAETRKAALAGTLALGSVYQSHLAQRAALQRELDEIDRQSAWQHSVYTGARLAAEWKTAALRVAAG